jgi:hypothetical protein
MKLLLIETEPGVAFPLEEQLLGDGHDVVQCNDEFGGPCKGVADHTECPMHSHIDLAIVARTEQSDRTLNEMGAVCAEQHRIPLVQVDPHEPDTALEDLDATAANARRKVEAEYAAAVRRELLQAGVEHAVEVEVSRTPYRVAAVVHLPERYSLATQQAALSDRARHAIRTHDPFVRVIDVSVVTVG